MSYKTDCPACGGNNFFVSDTYSYCFSPGCKYRENDTQRIQKQYERSEYIQDIRAYYTKIASYYHSSLNKSARDYLYTRGFTDQSIEQFKIGYCPGGKSPLYRGQIPIEAGLVNKHGEAFFADRITFPYFLDDTCVIDIRARSIKSVDHYKYLSPHNGAYYRGADYPYNYHLHREKTLIITEGEIKADLATQCGYATMALPGMGIWRHGYKQKEGQKVILMFDSQQQHMNDVRKAVINAARYLFDPYVATLPLLGQKKVDIDSFILMYGHDGLHTIVSGALPFEAWRALQR